MSYDTTTIQGKERLRSAMLKHRYNITAEQYDEMCLRQGGVCLLCSREPRRNRLHVDHDHVTGQVRGLLCTGCNTKLGWVDRVGLARLISYLGGKF